MKILAIHPLRALLCGAAAFASSVFAGPADFAWSEQELGDTIAWLKTHRLSEAAFIRAMNEPGTVILDASETRTFEHLRIAGALHLPVRAMNGETLARCVPDKNARILIYQNNNYAARRRLFDPPLRTNELGDPFAGEWSGENEMTCATLRRLGYRNVYELANYVEIGRGGLPVVSGASAADLDRPVTLSVYTGHQ